MAEVFSAQRRTSIFRDQAPGLSAHLKNSTAVERLSLRAAIAESEDYSQLDETLSRISSEIETGREPSVRNRLAQRRNSRQLQAFTEFLEGVDLSEEESAAEAAVEVAREVAGRDPRNDAPQSIEAEYVDTILSQDARPDPIDISDRRILDVDYDLQQERVATRMEMLQTRIDEIQAEREDRPWPMFFLEIFGTQAVPGAVSTAQSGLIGEASPVDNIWAGERVRQEGEYFRRAMVTMSDDEWNQFFPAFIERVQEAARRGGYEDLTAEQFMLEEIANPLPAGVTNTFNTIDNFLPFIGPILSSGRRITRTPLHSLRTVNRRRAAEATRDQLSRANVGDTPSIPEEDLLNEVLPSAINPEAGPSNVSNTGPILQESAAFDEAVEQLRTSRLTPEEAENARQAARQRLIDRFGEGRLTDIRILGPERLPSGQEVQNVEAILLKRDGSEFRSPQAALSSGRSQGLDPEVVQLESGNYGIRVEAPVSETGFQVTGLDPTVNHAISAVTLSGRLGGGPVLAAKAVVGEGIYNSVIEGVLTPVVQSVRRLSKNERRALDQITGLGNIEARWFDRAEFDEHYLRLTGRDSSDRAWESYQQWIELNDTVYHIRNATMYTEYQTQGWRTVSAETPFINITPQNAKIVDDIPANANGRVFNTETGEMVDELPDGFVVVELQDADLLSANNMPARYAAVRRTAVRERPLDYIQLGYREGGSRIYNYSYFVRRTRRTTLGDGTDYLLSPNTYIGAHTRKEAVEWTNTMESARLAYREALEEGLDPDSIATRLDELVFEDRAGYPTGREFIDDMERNGSDAPFEITLDRQLPSAYTRNPESRFNAHEDGFASMMQSQGRMYTSSRGDAPLPDYNGRHSGLLDFGEMMNRSVQQAARLAGFADYKNEFVSRWVQTYGDIVEAGTRSPMDLFLNGTIKDGIDARRAASAEAQRLQIRNALQFRDKGMINTDVLQRQITDWVADQNWLRSIGVKDPNEFARGVRDFMQTSNPQAALMGTAFNLKLGLFNIAQIPLQASHFAAIWQLSKAGTRANAGAFVNSMPGWLYSVNRNLGDDYLDTLVNRGLHRGLGMEADDYRAMMRAMRASGFTNPQGAHILRGEFGVQQGISSASGVMSRTLDAGRLPFNATEGALRSSSWAIAWREISEEFPNLDRTSEAFTTRVAGRADDYNFNMTRSTAARWQRGITAIPTQFWSYFTRMMEAMTSNKFSREQRARLVLGQSILFGLPAGLPFANMVPFVSESFGVTEPGPDAGQLNTVQGMIERGLLDHVYLWATGRDILISERVGPGAFAGDFIKSLFNESDFGPVSAGEILGGASFSIWIDSLGDAGQFVSDAVRFLTVASTGDTTGGPIARDSFMNMMSNISTVNNFNRAYMLNKFQVLQSSSGTILVDDLDPSLSLEAVFGLSPGEMATLGQNFRYLESQDEAVAEIVSVIRRYRGLQINDPDNTRNYADELRAYFRLNNPAYVQRALRETRGQWDSLYDAIQDRVDEARVREQVGDRIVEERQ